jgi:hypothetical protein
MKRAAMAAVRVVQRVHDVAETFKPAVDRLLKPGAHGVVISAISLMANIICVEPSYRANWTRYATAFTKILRQLHTSKVSREFACTVFNDSFLQIRLMRILAVLDRPSDDLDDVLESIVTGVDVKRNTRHALLFQAVEAIVATEKKPSLRGLAFSQVGRLFNLREANVLYSALSVFWRVFYTGREIVGRMSGDSIALQRFKTQVVHCLSHRDSSIRQRARCDLCARWVTARVDPEGTDNQFSGFLSNRHCGTPAPVDRETIVLADMRPMLVCDGFCTHYE